jgi:hypothetical protein
MSQVTGIVMIKLGGALQRSMEGATLDLGGKEREMVVGHSVYGHKEKVVPSVCTFKTAHVGGDDLIGTAATTDGTLEFETDTGDTYIVSGAVCTKSAKLNGGSGEVEWEFQGKPAELA